MDTPHLADAAAVPLEAVLCTEELQRRPIRPPDYATENRALVTLAQALADSPHTILQELSDTILEVFGAESAGVSLVTPDEKRFHWPAVAGAWKPHIGGGTPRDFGPCGDVLDRNAPLLFTHFERRYTYFLPVTPLVQECLLVPFYVEGKAVGTVWAITHDPDARPFDLEDLRLLTSLGRFASSACWAVESLERLAHQEEALQDADRRKNEFLAMLAHELRNPLAPIANALEIMRLTAGRDAPPAPEFRMMERQVGQIVRLVNDLLDAGRISRGKIRLRTGTVELASIVRHAVEAVRPQVLAMGHDLTVTLPPKAIYLDGDPIRLVQVVGNLLDNACKFTNRGGHVELAVEQDGDHAVLRIRDTGIGVAEHQLERIFEMFTQADTSLERTQRGLGIGLPLVKNLVELHGGAVTARSAGIGQGSEFVVRLPVAPDATQPSLEPDARKPQASTFRISP